MCVSMAKMKILAFFLTCTLLIGLFHAEECTSDLLGACSVSDPLNDPCCLPGLVCSDSVCLIPSGSTLPCGEGAHCLSGICSQNGTCVSFQACDGACESASECGSDCPFCIENACRSCAPQDAVCSSAMPCCSGTICSPSTSTCVLCLDLDEQCAFSSQCCSGRCLENAALGVKTCAPGFACGMGGGPCKPDSFNCCGSPPFSSDAFCSVTNPLPSSSFAGSCLSGCIPSGLNCNEETLPCCGDSTGYICSATPSSYGNRFCISDPGTGDHYQFSGWLSNSDYSLFSKDSHPHSGTYSLGVASNDPLQYAYIYNPGVVLEANSKYALEFWTFGEAYVGIYDPNNDAYYDTSSESWSFSPRDVDGREEPVVNHISSSGEFQQNLVIFPTLAQNVSQIQVRFYAGEVAYLLDDLAISKIDDFSMFAWIRLDNRSAKGIVFQQMAEEPRQGFVWSQSNSDIIMEYFSRDFEGDKLVTSVSLDGHGWHHVGFVANRLGSYSTYLDGAMVETGEFVLGRLNSTANFTVGAREGSFSGAIDEIRFYTRTLSDGEVLETYNGEYQARCTVRTKVVYEEVPSERQSIYYNADLRVSSLFGAILSFPFDVNISALNSKAIRDYSPYQRMASNTGAAWSPNGFFGGAYIFNGESDYLNLTAGTLGNLTHHTITAWVKPVYSGSSDNYPLFLPIAKIRPTMAFLFLLKRPTAA